MNEPVRITIQHNGRTYSAELPWDADLEDVTIALRGLLVSSGWNMETVLQYLHLPE